MFERFTNRARAVLVVAQDEARALGHDFIGTEHLLLGVIAAGDDVVTQALSAYDVTIDEVRNVVTSIVGPGDDDLVESRPFTPRSKKVLELSLREALALGHNHIGVPHILLAIMREGDGVGAQVLLQLGVDYDRTRMLVGQAIGEASPARGRRRRRRSMEPPGWLRGAAPGPRVGTHEVLLGLFDKPDSMAAQALDALGVTQAQVEAKIAEIGLENTSDAPPPPPARPATVALSEGVEVRISDPDLAKLVESGQVEELLKEIVRRSKPAS